jgi:uncharacterized protein DUF1360
MKGYSPHEHKPLLGYAALTAAFNGLAAAYVVQHRRSGRRWPQRFPAGDLALMAGATFKLSRLIAKDKVTSVLRSPFTRYKGDAGPSEVEEEARGTGLQLAIGELLVCPYCVGQWVAAAFVGGYARDPDATRAAAAVFALLAASDFLQQAWNAVDEAV